MIFKNELEFEKAFVKLLGTKGWETEVIENPTEKDLLDNWAKILFENNRGIDRLNDCPLTDTEMQQIIEQIKELRTPLKLNGLINGKTISIKRDNPDDVEHMGKEISLKIYDRKEIAAGQSRYQIVRQPKFNKKNKILNDRRGDVMLLINGMPVFHIELKRSGVPVSQAYHQIEKYAREGVFTGIFSLVQIFVAMNPDETIYFANPGPDGKFNTDYYFHWADFDNEPINNYKDIASKLLSIPMAHQLIGFYTVADSADGVLKVMRSYQYYAASAISDKLSNTKWEDKNQLGGFIWHTTGSGKTLTSFKSAQLIANSGDADKVVFLTDRIELGTQSLKEYRGFAEENDSVQATENTGVLITKLKSNETTNIMIVTSIQKMSNIKPDSENIMTTDIDLINKKKIVFIVDEAHRSTFGDMLRTIKETFPKAIFFGFTGTPIQEENQKKLNTTATIFGNELHRYSIADGIRDKNVLGFDLYKVLTFRDRDIREVIALEKAKANTATEAISDPKKAETYYHYMDNGKVKMYGTTGEDGKYIKGIEDYIPTSQYRTPEHQNKVVEDICDNFERLSYNYKFHAMFATSSIAEAIEYYRLFKQYKPELKVTCQIDPNIDNKEGGAFKGDGLIEIIEDYNKRYGQDFTLSSIDKLKKDIALRLAHKEHYKGIENTPELQIDLLIVVDQMLTGFDSKWINTLYMDKMMEYANIIQAFSRTNRLFDLKYKPFGTIKYYRKPHTMEQNINAAVKLYSGDKPVILFVDKLRDNLKQLNHIYKDIKDLFTAAGIPNLEKLPDDKSERNQFARLFKALNLHLEAAKIQGFSWDKEEYRFSQKGKNESVRMEINETIYLTLANRYKELSTPSGGTEGGGIEDTTYDLVGYLTEIDTGKIDTDYMNRSFEKYLRLKRQDSTSLELIEQALNELHKTFATLTKDEQKYAEIFMHDVEKGEVKPEVGKTLRDYITEYQEKAYDNQIHRFAQTFGVDEDKLRNMVNLGLNESNLNEFGRFDNLKSSINKQKAKEYFEEKEGTTIILPKVNKKMDKLLRQFVLTGGFDI